MEKQDNYSAAPPMAPILTDLDYSTMIPAEVLQFADFGPRLALNHHCNELGDSSHHNMLKFPVLHDHHHDNGEDVNDHMIDNYFPHQSCQENIISSNEPVAQLEFLGASGNFNQTMVMNTATPLDCNNNNNNKNNNGKRKRSRTMKTRQEVESQRMTHIAVERNRRKQMNEHLRVLRTLMPSSYVQRGDQASIIGGAIEFVRELEQLLQCLESQKRRRLYGETNDNTGAVPLPLDPNSQPFDPNNNQTMNADDAGANMNTLIMNMAPNVGPNVDLGGVLQEETAENKSSIADIEVKLLGFDAFIKILSRRRHGQLIRAISGLQDLQFTILHTNITTVEQTVLYSFNVKISNERSFSAEDIASSVQQIFKV